MKAIIRYHQPPSTCCVDVIRDYLSGERVTTTYFAPSGGGYVRNADTNSQVCEGLSSRGPTLVYDPKHGSFIDLIRREYRRSKKTA